MFLLVLHAFLNNSIVAALILLGSPGTDMGSFSMVQNFEISLNKWQNFITDQQLKVQLPCRNQVLDYYAQLQLCC